MIVEKEYTPEEVAEIIKLNIEVVRRKLREGEIKGVKRGRLWRVLESEIKRIQKEGY